MKFIPLVWAGIRRKRARSILILLQVIIAFTLYGTLQGLNSGIKHAVDATHADRVYVMSRQRLGAPIPISMLQRLESVPGVVQAVPRVQVFGDYQKPRQGIVVMGTDTKKFPRLFPEYQFDPGQLAALQNTRNAVIVGGETARKYGFKAGDRITLQTQTLRKDGSRNWTFDIVGTYENQDAPDTAIQLLGNYDYINEALPDGQGKDTMMLAMVRIADPTQAATIGNTIDDLFANSANETLTQSEHELAESQVNRIGDLDLVVRRITGAAFFVLLFSTGALMMQSIRERTPELAVLKTFGFPDILVMTLILGETLLLCIVGAAIGLWIASNILPLARQFIGIGSVPRSVIVTGFVVAILLGLAGGAIPAWRGLRLRVVDALADR